MPALDALIRSCIQQRQLAVAASSSAASSAASGSASSASSSTAAASSAPSAHVVCDDADDEDEDDDDGNEPYVMRCCNTLWAEGTVLVACSKCMDWFHLGKLGTCSGEGITRKKAQTRGYEHVCHLCVPKSFHYIFHHFLDFLYFSTMHTWSIFLHHILLQDHSQNRSWD